MITETVDYDDFLDRKKTKKLYFHIGVAKFLENFEIEREMREIGKFSEGDTRTLEEHEMRQILNVVTKIIRMGYGVRSDDGDRFSQTEEVWLAFRESAAYDSFLLSLFTDQVKANEFIQRVMTRDLRDQAVAQATPEQLAELDGTEAPEDNRPQWLKENREPTPDEFISATKEQQLLAYQMKSARS